VWAAAAVVYGVVALRGVRARVGPQSIRIVPQLFARERDISYAEIVRVRLLGVPSSQARIAWTPGLHLRIELSSGEEIIMRALHPWASRGQCTGLRKLQEELTAVTSVSTCAQAGACLRSGQHFRDRHHL
jgi:hypothetical protein